MTCHVAAPGMETSVSDSDDGGPEMPARTTYYYTAYFQIVPQWANITFLPKYLFITLYNFILAVRVIIVYMLNFKDTPFNKIFIKRNVPILLILIHLVWV